jgi:hypothetical protein
MTTLACGSDGDMKRPRDDETGCKSRKKKWQMWKAVTRMLGRPSAGAPGEGRMKRREGEDDRAGGDGPEWRVVTYRVGDDSGDVRRLRYRVVAGDVSTIRVWVDEAETEEPGA